MIHYATRLLFGCLLMTTLACGQNKDYLVTISTRHGEIKAVLFDDTPKHKDNFLSLAESGRFDSTHFHRVIEGFMVQGGDVFTKEELPPQEWPTVPAEINVNHYHRKGMIAAARQGDAVNPTRASNGSQFYIVLGRTYEELELTTDFIALQKAVLQYVQLESQKPFKEEYNRLYAAQAFDTLTTLMLSKRDEIAKSLNLTLTKSYTPAQIQAYATIGGTPHLDREYTVFGEVISGMDVVEKIAAEPTTNEIPNDLVYMKVKVERISKKKITEEYGYNYPTND